MTGIPLAMKPPEAAKPDVAAKQLEAFFLRQLLAEARPKGGMLDGGFAGDTFAQMLDDAISDKLSAGGGIGMAGMFAAQLANGADVPIAQPPRAPEPAPRIGPSIEGLPQLALPVIGRPSSGYGMRIHPITHASSMHPGFDLAAPTGTAVSAAAAGKVTHAGPAGTYGNLVTIRHADGFETRYAHLSAVSVTEGARVNAGDDIGKVGSTGMSTGPHLHFELRKDGKSMDPKPLLPATEVRQLDE